MKKKIWQTGIDTIRRLQNPYYQGTAAEIGLYFIFAIVPILALLLQFANYVETAQKLFYDILFAIGGNKMLEAVMKSVFEVNTGKFSLVFLAVALWSSSKLHFSMIRIANNTYNMGTTGFIGYFKARGRAVFTTILLIVMMIASVAFLVFGNMMLGYIDVLLEEDMQSRFDMFYSAFRWPIMLGIYWAIIALNYKLLPSESIKLKEVIPGSLFAAVGILVATFVYYIYFKYFSHINLVYGSLGAIIAMLLWFYWLGFILVVGMIINASWFGYGEDD